MTFGSRNPRRGDHREEDPLEGHRGEIHQEEACQCYAPGLILCATRLSVLIFRHIRLTFAYVYHRTALPLIPDIPAISILSCFRFTDASWLTCLFGSHFSRLRCPFDSYLPPLFLARVSHFYSYNSDLFCSLLSTILRISQPISGFLTRLLGLL